MIRCCAYTFYARKLRCLWKPWLLRRLKEGCDRYIWKRFEAQVYFHGLQVGVTIALSLKRTRPPPLSSTYSPRNRRTKTGSSATLKSETKAATTPSQTLCITSFALFYLLPLLDINFISWFGNKTPPPSTVCDLYMLFLRFLYSLLICHDILWYIFTCGKHNLAFLWKRVCKWRCHEDVAVDKPTFDIYFFKWRREMMPIIYASCIAKRGETCNVCLFIWDAVGILKKKLHNLVIRRDLLLIYIF